MAVRPNSDNLIRDYRFELVPDHHSPGSGRYGLLVTFAADISDALPYLNSHLGDTRYDKDLPVLIGLCGQTRCAFRPHEIRAGGADPPDAARLAAELVATVNRVWAERDRIKPSLRPTAGPSVYVIFRLLPGTNCKDCGSPTCLAFAARVREGEAGAELCPLLALSEYAANRSRIADLLRGD